MRCAGKLIVAEFILHPHTSEQRNKMIDFTSTGFVLSIQTQMDVALCIIIAQITKIQFLISTISSKQKNDERS